ncbi:MAG: hypothetical protein V8T46_08530 [Sutterella seckii]
MTSQIRPENLLDSRTETIPFFFGPATLLIPFLLFAAASVYLFAVLKVFDLMALAGAGLAALVSSTLLDASPGCWKAVLEGAASELTATVLLLLMAAGIFSAMMKAADSRRRLLF